MEAATIKYDLHSHLLPGIDDGVRDLDEALQSIECLMKLGYAGAVTTPHIYPEVFDNSEADLQFRFEDLYCAVRERFPGFSLKLAAEYYFDGRLVNKLFEADNRLLTVGHQEKGILVEFARTNIPANLSDLFLGCQRRGLRPIIAHVERYSYVHEDKQFSLIKDWVDQGALLQMDLGSAVGQYGLEAMKTSNAILKQGFYHFIGTDLHRKGQCDRFIAPAWKKMERLRFEEKWHLQLVC